jgi:hypothetical protein
VFEGSRDLHLREDAQEERTGVGCEPAMDRVREAFEIEVGVDDQRGHPGATVLTGDRDAVDVRLVDAGIDGDHLADLARRDVLALPAEGVADPVDEEVEPVLVDPQEIARPEIGNRPSRTRRAGPSSRSRRDSCSPRSASAARS